MTYTPPNLKGNKVIYKGKRYWIFETNENDFEGFDKDYCDLIFYDKLYDGILALITKVESKKPTWKADLLTHVEISYTFDSMETLIKSVPKLMDEYFKQCNG